MIYTTKLNEHLHLHLYNLAILAELMAMLIMMMIRRQLTIKSRIILRGFLASFNISCLILKSLTIKFLNRLIMMEMVSFLRFLLYFELGFVSYDDMKNKLSKLQVNASDK